MHQILRQVDFFNDLSDEALERVSAYTEKIVYEPDHEIFREGDEGDAFYIIAEGRIEIMKQIREDLAEQAELKIFEKNDYFGEMSLLDNTPRSATARTLLTTTLLRLPKEQFLQTCNEHPDILFRLMRTITSRLRHSNEQFARVVNSLIMKNKMAAIGSAASKIVHDIKNPITVIILSAQLVESLHPETAKYMKKVVKQTETLNDMVREILDFARGERISLEIEPVDLCEFFGSVVEDLEPVARDNKVELKVDCDITAPLPLDNRRMRRVIINIVKNAMEAMNDPGVIVLQAKEEGEFCRISIVDDGPGIPEDLLPTIFEPFVTRGKKSGTGLGLAISHKVVTDHRGRIEASNWEDGACFDIWLPLSLS